MRLEEGEEVPVITVADIRLAVAKLEENDLVRTCIDCGEKFYVFPVERSAEFDRCEECEPNLIFLTAFANRITISACSPRYDSGPLCHYVIVRADLPRGIQAANIVHAAGESSPGDLPSGTHAVVLVARSEHELHDLATRLERAEVKFVRVEEPDMPWDGALMALGLAPARKEDVRRFLSSLPLLK